MSYEFTKLSEVPAVSEFPEGANAIIETNGEIKRCPPSNVPKPLTYDYMPAGYPTKSVQTTTLMEEQEVGFADDKGLYFGPSPAIFDIVIGGTYTVIWDGTEYQCVGSAVNSRILLGNLSIVTNAVNTGEPFVYVPAEGGFYTLDTSVSHTISVKTTEETVTPMAEEFLPAGMGTTVFYYN